MAIVLTFQVQEMDHGVVHTLRDDDQEPFLAVCRRFTDLGVRYVDFIQPYQDAMLNEFQLRAWAEDFPEALKDAELTSEQRESGARVLAAAEEAVERSGYLFIEG